MFGITPVVLSGGGAESGRVSLFGILRERDSREGREKTREKEKEGRGERRRENEGEGERGKRRENVREFHR